VDQAAAVRPKGTIAIHVRGESSEKTVFEKGCGALAGETAQQPEARELRLVEMTVGRAAVRARGGPRLPLEMTTGSRSYRWRRVPIVAPVSPAVRCARDM
jgi:hypothetical protein